MRQSSHGVTTSCATPLTPGKKYVAVQLLTKETLYCEVDTKAKVQHVFDQVCSYLGLKDAELFGLALFTDNEFLFLDTGIKLSKLASKTWKSQSNNGLDSIGRPLLTLHLSIKFYVDCPLLVRDKQTRHHYYLQLKGNFLQHCQACSEERCFLLAAYALQADFGNFNEERHHGKYFEPREYFPPWILTRLSEEYIIQNAPSIHKDYKSYSKGDAEMAFIKEASLSDAPHHLHIYKLKKKKNDLLGSIWLGICSRGIEIYENGGVNSRTKKLMSTFLWADIGKLCFEKKKFEIRAMSYADTRKYTYYTGNDDKSKHLLYLCRTTHLFNLAIQPRVSELKRLELEEKKSYRESYIYSDSLDLEWEQEHGPSDMSLHDFNTLSKKGKVPNDQRTSVISNASSNTTSGIVSDRVQSLDGSEDEMDSAREPESPQPPMQPVEASNCMVLLAGDNNGGQMVPVGGPSQPPPSEPVEPGSGTSRPSPPLVAVSNVESVHSSSSDKSVSTVRSRFSLVKSSIPSVPPAFSVPYLPHSSPQHSASASDTYSSFDHSYTSSLDSSTAQMMSFLGGSQMRQVADSLTSASSTEDSSEWPLETTKYFYGTSRAAAAATTTRPVTSSVVTVASSCSPASTPSRTCANELYLPPLPIRSELSYGRNVATGLSRKPTSSASPQSSNDESSLGYAPSMGLYHAMPMTCLNARPTSLHINGVCMPHSMQHGRTKIGVSSLTRPANSTYGALATQRHRQVPQKVPTSRLEALANSGRYCYYGIGGGHSNLLTLGKSISVPNVINENECLPMSAAATYPPMTMPFSNKVAYCSNEALPAYPQMVHPPRMALQDNLWPSVPDYYIKGPELPRGYSESPIPPPSDFAYIPPPPPYCNPQGSEDLDSISSFGPTLTPPRGFRQDGPTSTMGDNHLSTSSATGMANMSKGPMARPRTIFPMKAKSEENLLSQGMIRPTGYIPLTPNGVHSNGLEEIHESKVELQFPAIPPPPPYGPEMTASLSNASSPDGSSSIESLQRSKEELPEIQKLRERSRDLDLPLITALCNDRSLMTFSNALGNPSQAGMDVRRLSYSTPVTPMKTTLGGRPFSWHVDSGSSLCDYNGLLTPRNYISCTLGEGATSSANILPPTPLTKWSTTSIAPKLVSSPQAPPTPPSTSICVPTSFAVHQATGVPLTSSGIIEWPTHAMVTSMPEHQGIPSGIVNGGMPRISALR